MAERENGAGLRVRRQVSGHNGGTLSLFRETEATRPAALTRLKGRKVRELVVLLLKVESQKTDGRAVRKERGA